MTSLRPLQFVVDPHLEADLTASPTPERVEAWRRRIGGAGVTADPSTVLGALLTRFDGLSVEHDGAQATLRWCGTTVVGGEKCLVTRMELSTARAHTAVLALARHGERLFGVPVSTDARSRIEELLRETIAQHGDEGSLPEERFVGVVNEALQELPRRIAATPPAESLGSWVREHGIRELVAEPYEVPLARSQRLVVLLRKEDSTLQPARDGVWFAPVVSLRRISARGKVLSETEQQIFVGFLGADTMFEPLPDAARQAAALEVLRRWKAALVKRIARHPKAGAKSSMPMDLPWPTSPTDLVVQTLRHGPAGPRPVAGDLGSLAAETARTLRELDDAEVAQLALPGVLRGYRVGAFTLLLRRNEDDEDDERESLWLRRDGGDVLPVVFWFEENREAFSADGDEPTFRLFARWMRSALDAAGLDRKLPNGLLPSEWVLLQDRDGDPLDHRVVEGMISARSYVEAEVLPDGATAADHATRAVELFRTLVREIIDPKARFGQKVAELGVP